MEYMTNQQAADILIESLKEWNPKIWHRAATGSIYIKFPHWMLGSIRIGDHNKREKYKYRFEVRTDLEPAGVVIKNKNTYIYDPGALNLLVEKFKKIAEGRGIKPGDKQTWEQANKLYTPKWKDKKYKQVGII